MKASDKPQFSKKWWVSERPKEIEGTDLEKALQKAEKALADAKKNNSVQVIDTCLVAVKAVGGAATKTIKECDKKKHKDVITVLKKYDPLVKTETNRLGAAKSKVAKATVTAGDDDEDVSDDQLFEKDYLYKMMKLMKSAGKELRFGFGLNTNAPEASKLLLKRKGKPELLFKTLKKTKEFSNRLLTYGYAKADPDDGQTLVFRLDAGANEPPRIIKLGRKFLRADKKLRFRKLKLVLPSGKTIEDSEPDIDDMEEAAVAAGGEGAVTETPVEQETETATPDRRKQFKQARKSWVRVRDRAIQDLEVVKDGIRDYYLDDAEQFQLAAERMTRLDEIMDNLSDDLRDTLDTYVSTPLKDQAKLTELGAQAKKTIDRFLRYVKESKLLAAIDQKEFADITVKAPIETALNNLVRTIK